MSETREQQIGSGGENNNSYPPDTLVRVLDGRGNEVGPYFEVIDEGSEKADPEIPGIRVKVIEERGSDPTLTDETLILHPDTELTVIGKFDTSV